MGAPIQITFRSIVIDPIYGAATRKNALELISKLEGAPPQPTLVGNANGHTGI